MKKIQFENNNFILYSPDTLKFITYDLEEILNESLNKYKEIFDVDDFRKVSIYYFDNINNFREYVYSLRGEKESLPEYAKGVYDNGSIIGYIEPNIIKETPLYTKRKLNASHELFHIMYQELIWDKTYDRIVWFDEGMAQFFSNDYKSHLINKAYDEFVRQVFSKTKILPNLNELSHGSSFQNENYNGYYLSLIAVKYIYDSIGLEEFKKLLHNPNRIKEYGENVLKVIKEKYS